MGSHPKVRAFTELLLFSSQVNNKSHMSIPAELLHEVVGRNHHELLRKIRGMITNESLGSRTRTSGRDMTFEGGFRTGVREERRRILALLDSLVAYRFSSLHNSS